MSSSHRVWAVEVLRNGVWMRLYSHLYTNIDDASENYRVSRRSIEDMKGVTDIRIAEYRGYDFSEPYTTIP